MPKNPSAFFLGLLLAALPASAQFDNKDGGTVSVPHFRRASLIATPTQTGASFASALSKAAAEMAGKRNTAGAGDPANGIGFASKVGCGSPCYINQAFNPDFWVSVDPAFGRFAVKPGVQPADAIEDVTKNPTKYKIECATAIKIVLYKAILETIGTSSFNGAAKKTPLQIGSGPYESLIKDIMRRALNADNDTNFPGMARDVTNKSDDNYFISTMKPGDGVYMVNLKSKGGAGGGWGGENALFIGGGKFYGHPLGLRTADEIATTLKSDWDPAPGPSQVAGQDNGPPGFVYDIYRPKTDVIQTLGQ